MRRGEWRLVDLNEDLGAQDDGQGEELYKDEVREGRRAVECLLLIYRNRIVIYKNRKRFQVIFSRAKLINGLAPLADEQA